MTPASSFWSGRPATKHSSRCSRGGPSAAGAPPHRTRRRPASDTAGQHRGAAPGGRSHPAGTATAVVRVVAVPTAPRSGLHPPGAGSGCAVRARRRPVPQRPVGRPQAASHWGADWGGNRTAQECSGPLRNDQGRPSGPVAWGFTAPPGPGPASLAGSSPVTHPTQGGPGRFTDQGLPSSHGDLRIEIPPCAPRREADRGRRRSSPTRPADPWRATWSPRQDGGQGEARSRPGTARSR
jgi:hypothetical protein